MNKASIPNALTGARLIGAAAFIALLALPVALSPAVLIAATAIFVISAITDALDGYLARRWNAVSPFGRIADPLADKILVLGAFVMLAGPVFALEVATEDGTAILMRTGVAVWMPVVILSRELVVTTIRGYYESKGIDFSAGLSGKVKMIIQSVAVPLILLIVAYDLTRDGTEPTRSILNPILAWTTVGVTVWSAIPYIQRAIAAERTLRESPIQTDSP